MAAAFTRAHPRRLDERLSSLTRTPRSWEWRSECGRDRADDAGTDQGDDDGASEGEERDRGGGEDAVLPGVLERERERDGDADDGADRGGAGAVEEGAGARVVAETVEVRCAEEHERERGREGDERGEQTARDAAAA